VIESAHQLYRMLNSFARDYPCRLKDKQLVVFHPNLLTKPTGIGVWRGRRIGEIHDIGNVVGQCRRSQFGTKSKIGNALYSGMVEMRFLNYHGPLCGSIGLAGDEVTFQPETLEHFGPFPNFQGDSIGACDSR
jgi:hypothetical protein